MNTIEHLETPGRGARKAASASGARPDMIDVVLLLATILALMGAAAGIAIGFPLALEVVSAQANAAVAVYPAPQARTRLEPEETVGSYDEPLIVDDVRSEARMYAATGIATAIDRSAPAASGSDAAESLSQMKDGRRDSGEHEGIIPSF